MRRLIVTFRDAAKLRSPPGVPVLSRLTANAIIRMLKCRLSPAPITLSCLRSWVATIRLRLLVVNSVVSLCLTLLDVFATSVHFTLIFLPRLHSVHERWTRGLVRRHSYHRRWTPPDPHFSRQCTGGKKCGPLSRCLLLTSETIRAER